MNKLMVSKYKVNMDTEEKQNTNYVPNFEICHP